MTKSEILKTLYANGYTAYFVGGCVRDLILEKTPNDFDVATSATPDKIKQIFSSCKFVCAGEKHGTIGILCDDGLIEVTTFRKESNYSDFRHPDEVIFTTLLNEDLARRDFTCNAIAMDVNGDIIDIFGGQEDIKNKLIRTVGNADKRFSEDALRILRAFRFAAQCDFEIEQNTLISACSLAKNLRFISKERIFAELTKMLSSCACYKILPQALDVFLAIFPTLKKEHWQQICLNASLVNQNGILLLACILKYCDFKKELNDLKADSATKNTVTFLLTQTLTSENAITKKIGIYGFKNVKLLGEFINILSKNPSDDLLKKIDACKDNICNVKQLKLNGNDVKSLGIKDKNIGLALEFLLDACIDKKCNNSRKELLNYLENSINMFK